MSSPNICPACDGSEGGITGCNDAARALAALPRVVGPKHAAVFVSNHLALLERLVLDLGPHLRNASTEELAFMIGGCAGLR